MSYVWLQSSIWSNRFKTILLILIFPTFLYGLIFLTIGIINHNQLWNTEIVNNNWKEAQSLTTDIFIILWPIIIIWLLLWLLFHRQLIFSFSWAIPVTRKEYPEIYNIVENLCISRWLPTPNIGILEDDSYNAFALWRDVKKSWIVFSRWIINKLNKQEIEAVAGHELTHIINKDSLVMIIIIVFIWAIATIWEILFRVAIKSWKWSWKKDWRLIGIMLIVWICFLVLWYLLFPLIRLAISRKREYLADAWSIELTKNNHAMISALQKISSDPVIETIKKWTVAAMCIENPFSKDNWWFMKFFSNLLSTHPSIEDRIKALKSY